MTLPNLKVTGSLLGRVGSACSGGCRVWFGGLALTGVFCTGGLVDGLSPEYSQGPVSPDAPGVQVLDVEGQLI